MDVSFEKPKKSPVLVFKIKPIILGFIFALLSVPILIPAASGEIYSDIPFYVPVFIFLTIMILMLRTKGVGLQLYDDGIWLGDSRAYSRVFIPYSQIKSLKYIKKYPSNYELEFAISNKNREQFKIYSRYKHYVSSKNDNEFIVQAPIWFDLIPIKLLGIKTDKFFSHPPVEFFETLQNKINSEK